MSTPDLDAIQNRSDDAMMHESLEPGSYAEIAWHSARDVPDLLAYARDLEARVERAWDEGFDRGFYDPLAGSGRDASESPARNPYSVRADS